MDNQVPQIEQTPQIKPLSQVQEKPSCTFHIPKAFIICIAILFIAIVGIGLFYIIRYTNHKNSSSKPQTKNAQLSSLFSASPTPSTPSVTGNSCKDITTTGNYYLTQDLTTNDICFNVHDVSAVNLDCQNHKIVSKFGTNLQMKNVTNFSIKNCELQITNDNGGDTISLQSSSNGAFENNTMQNGDIVGSHNTNVTFLNNTVTTHAPFSQSNSSYMTLKGNVFTSDTKVTTTILGGEGTEGSSGASYVIQLGDGMNNSITNNTLDGKWDGILQPGNNGNVGVDDGILLSSEKNDVITNNTISNNWDCGIENIGHLDSTQISQNKIKNTGICGIGGWYWNSWSQNIVDSNTIDITPTMFYLYRTNNFDTTHNEQNVFFKDNVFRNNVFSHPKAYPGKNAIASSINFFGIPSEIPTSAVIVGNNVFKNNNFGSSTDSPFISPGTMAIDEGGNSCQQITDASHPLKCTY